MERSFELFGRTLRDCLAKSTLILFNQKAIEREGGSFGVLKPDFLESLWAKIEQAAFYLAQDEGKPDFVELVSLAAYLIVKEHPFQDGNKRTSVKVIVNCLRKLDLVYTGRPIDLARKIEEVAKSDPSQKREIVLNLAYFLKKHLQKTVF